jgi:uncharacterized MnhB-related membrane protein
MTAMEFLLLIHHIALGAIGMAVVAARDPRRQACIGGVFGLVQASLFFLMQAPDVALSELVIGTVGVPGMLLFTLSLTAGKRQ